MTLDATFWRLPSLSFDEHEFEFKDFSDFGQSSPHDLSRSFPGAPQLNIVQTPTESLLADSQPEQDAEGVEAVDLGSAESGATGRLEATVPCARVQKDFNTSPFAQGSLLPVETLFGQHGQGTDNCFSKTSRLPSLPYGLPPTKHMKSKEKAPHPRLSVRPVVQVSALSQPPRKRRGQVAHKKETLQDLERKVAAYRSLIGDLESSNEDLKLRTEVYDFVLRDRDYIMKLMSEHGPTGRVWFPFAGVRGFSTDLSLESLYVTGQATKALSPQQLALRWKCYVQRASSLLVNLDKATGPDADSSLELTNLCSVIGSTAVNCTALNLPCIAQMSSMNMETGVAECPADEFWLHVLQALNLTPKQNRQIAELYRICTQPLQTLLPEYDQLKRQVDQRLVLQTASNGCACDMLARLGNEAEDALRLLERNLELQNMYYAQLGTNFFMLLNTKQMAVAAVQSYPYFPCSYSISKIVCMGCC